MLSPNRSNIVFKSFEIQQRRKKYMKMFIFDSMANQRSAGALLKSLCRLFGYLSFISFFSAFLRDIFKIFAIGFLATGVKQNQWQVMNNGNYPSFLREKNHWILIQFFDDYYIVWRTG